METIKSPPPSLIVRELADFDEFHDLFGAWGGQFQQTSRGRFSGAAAIYAGLSVRAFRATTNQAIFTRGLDQSDLVTVIPITEDNENTFWRGRQLTKGNLLVKGPDVEYYNQTSRNTIIQALLVPLQTFRSIVGPIADVMVGHKSSTSIALQPSGEAMQRFQVSLEALVTAPGPVHRRNAEVMERACLDDLLACLFSSNTDTGIKKLAAKRLELIDAALDLMNQRIDKGLKSENLCITLQVNDRMLRRIFKRAFGSGPMAMHRLLRLNRFRHELKSARGSDQTVATLAHHCGFSRMGALAAEYKTQFGEFPSETLGVRGRLGIQRTVRQERANSQHECLGDLQPPMPV
ncbi:helix-turn-helix domain-containing protein [Pseudomonadota bacterium]